MDAEDLGLPDGFDFGDVKDHKEVKNRTKDMWTMFKLQKRVEANKEGLDRLFEMITDIFNGGEKGGEFFCGRKEAACVRLAT